LRATCEAAWIVGPSAIGSENGTPSSSTSAPAPAIVSTRRSVVCRSGNPAVRKSTKLLRPSRAASAKCSSMRFSRMEPLLLLSL
jgi:hypothetical protein